MLILSWRFASCPEPLTRLAPSQALAVRPVLIQWSVSCVWVKLFRSFSYCAVMVNKYSLREHIYIYNTYIKYRKSCAKTRRKFRRKYPNRPLIWKNTILRLVKTFNETGSVNGNVRKQTRRILIEAKLDEISVALHGSPRKSLRCLAQQTGVCKASEEWQQNYWN